MLYQIRSYFRFLWKSTNQHGVHSPFVYGLVTRCFYDRKKHSAYELLSRYRSTLRNNRAQIEMKDLGAGSRVFNSSERRVSDIAKNAGITPKRARLLNRLVRYLEVERALELGTSLGIGTAAMAAGNKTLVQTIEGCPATAAIAEDHFHKFGLDNIELLQGEFDAVLDKLNDRLGADEIRKAEKIATSSFLVGQEAANAAVETPTPESRGASGNGAQALQASALKDQDVLRKEAANKGLISGGNVSAENKETLQQNKDSEGSNKAEINSAQGTTNRWLEKKASEKNLKEPFEEGLPQNTSRLLPTQETFRSDITYSLVFFDGNHQKEATLRYFEKILPFAHNDSVFIFDDIHWSREMEEAWEQIKTHPSVRVSIDTYQWGLVFFRREQVKEHFVIRV